MSVPWDVRAARLSERGATVPALCLATFAVVWTALALEPRYPDAWLLENLLVFAAVPILIFTYPRFRFSDGCYVQITAFFLLHAIGSHYTYSEVPIGDWARDTLGLSRNHYDRVVHFAFGLLLVHPLQELTLRRARGLGRVATAWIGFAGIAALGGLYELLEWAAAVIVDPDAGTAFLGTQGDVWDAQKDTALACAGAVAALWLSAEVARFRRTGKGHPGPSQLR